MGHFFLVRTLNVIKDTKDISDRVKVPRCHPGPHLNMLANQSADLRPTLTSDITPYYTDKV